MSFFLNTILADLLVYRYAVLFIVTLLASIALPIPAAATLMASAAFAGQGYFSFTAVIVVASLGNIIGDNIGYWLSRLYGRPVLNRIGFRRLINSQNFQTLQQRVNEHPAWIIFITRFEVISTLSINLVTGLSHMNYGKYLTWEVSGEITQVLVYGTIGYLVGSNWQTVYNLLNRFSILVLVVVIAALFFFWKKILGKS